jgi:hypothetical protein
MNRLAGPFRGDYAMKRLLIGFTVCTSFLVFGASALGQDAIHYFDRQTKKNEILKGTITSETPAEVTCKPSAGGKAMMIRSADISEIEYQYHDTGKIARLQWTRPTNALRRARVTTKPADRDREVKTALEAFRELAPLVAENKTWTRNVQFGIAEALALQAEGDAAGVDPAISALKKFRADHGDGWQLVKATKMLVRLLELKGDEAGAQATYTEMADNPSAPKEVRQEFGLLVVRHLLLKGKHAEAATKAKAIQQGLADDDPQAVKLKVYLAACDIAASKLDGVEQVLKAVVEGAADDDVKALARNTLGDYYRSRGQGEKAFWEYLWVDIHYNEDREELAKALYYLARLFADVRKEPARAKECLDRLCDEKQFGGLEYHRKALAEKSAEK